MESADVIRERPTVLWVVIALIALNFWHDYYHLRGFVTDAIIPLVLFVS